MEITKEFLQARIVGMQEQLGAVLGQAARIRGGIADCETLLMYLATPPPPPEPEGEGKEITPAMGEMTKTTVPTGQ